MYAVTIIFFAALGVAAAPLITQILNRMPDRCFCDYDEIPDERHRPPRVSLRKQGLPCGLFLTVNYILLGLQFGLTVKSVMLCLFFAVLVMISLSDLRFCIIPDELLVTGGILALLTVFGDGYGAAVLGAFIGAGIILLMNLLGHLIYHKDALGMGDLKLMAICGIVGGPTGVVIAMIIGIITAGLRFAFAMVTGHLQPDQYSPLGPYLVFGTIFMISCRPLVNAVLAWYLSLL